MGSEQEKLVEQVVQIIAKLPKGTVGITDPLWVARRVEQERPKSVEILNLIKEWGEEPCPHAFQPKHSKDLWLKRECSECWQALKGT